MNIINGKVLVERIVYTAIKTIFFKKNQFLIACSQRIEKKISIFCVLLFFFSISVYAQSKRALLIGISDYPQNETNSWNNIHGTNDVDLISKTLKTQFFKITTIINKSATASKIRKVLKRFPKSCELGDIIYLHFSCHGQPVEDLDGDEDDGWDEALVPIDALKEYQKGKYIGENHIVDDELNIYLNSIRKKVGPKGFVYVVVDACHAGSSFRGDEEEDSVIVRGTNRGFSLTGKQFAPKIDKRGQIKIEKSTSMANICILEACRSYQVNSEIKEKGNYYGSLSYYVNKVLQSEKLGTNMNWVFQVNQYMNRDKRLLRQNLVIETSM